MSKETKAETVMPEPPYPYEPSPLGRYVRQRREHLGISIRELAARTGMDKGNLSRLESGAHQTTRLELSHLQGLAYALNIDVTKLLKLVGLNPKPELPAMRTYFRRKLGVGAEEADILARLINEHRTHNDTSH